MLRKSQRLTRKEFEKVFRQGRAFHTDDFIVKYSPSSREVSRFGVSCGLKVSKKAVERNYLRRIIYDVVARTPAPVAPGDYIVIVKPTAKGKAFAQLQGPLREVLAHIYGSLSHSPH